MAQFTALASRVVVLPVNDVDTDQIIPAQFLKRIERTGFGEFLFYDWRYNADGSKQESFVLHQPQYQAASILLAGKNFGCGSSREHAVWALDDYGFRAIIATSFADIFANNSLKNGLLTVVLSETDVAELMKRAQQDGYELTVDLEREIVEDSQGFSATFPVDDFSRHCLLNGLDDIGLTLQQEHAIAAYEKTHPVSAVMAAAFPR